MEELEAIINAQEKDLGDFTVRRILPYSHCMIGPFIFFDHMGPANFAKDHGVDVRPHPHINLATVTFLFDGVIRHRDSLGSDQLIEPGAINWMVAGHGIVHSERTPQELRHAKSNLHGIQCWLALPNEYEEIPPSFTHYPAEVLPEFHITGAKVKVLLGTAFEQTSPVNVYSDMFYVSVDLPKGTQLTFPAEQREAAAYLVSGQALINGQQVEHCTMAVAKKGADLYLEALQDCKIMLLGGKPVGQRYIYWNFVSSSKEKLEKALTDWKNGPGDKMSRFPKIPGDDQDFIPLPTEKHELNPKGTIM